jgi:glutamine amidotransferase
MCCRHPSGFNGALRALGTRAQGNSRNRDGWGVAYYQGRDVALYRGTSRADTCPQVRFLDTTAPATTLALAYIRHATQGERTLANTAPFGRELHGRMQVFAHNGNLKYPGDLPRFSDDGFQPIGDTDSEKACCQLLNRIKALEHPAGALPSLQMRLDAVAGMALELRELGPASFLYADSDTLFAHADRRLQPLTGTVTPPAMFRLDCQSGHPLASISDCPPQDQEHKAVLLASPTSSTRLSNRLILPGL